MIDVGRRNSSMPGRFQVMQFIWGIVLSANKGMLALARSHGFTVKKVQGGKDYEIRIDLVHPSETVPEGS
jgi:hypothetical protein